MIKRASSADGWRFIRLARSTTGRDAPNGKITSVHENMVAGIAYKMAVGSSPSTVRDWQGLRVHTSHDAQKRIHERTEVHSNTVLLALIG